MLPWRRVSWVLHFEIAWREGGLVPVEISKKAGRALRGYFEKAKSLGLVVLEPSSEEPSRGSGTERVYRAEVPRLDGPAVARAFLALLSAKRLIAWCGPEDTTIERLAALVEQINGGRWRGADAVLRALEQDPAVDEVFATDRQLDDLWRQAVAR
jgi:hypothetical protein